MAERCCVLIALLLLARVALGCDSVVLTGLAKHGDRSHDYNSTTWGAGCEWGTGKWRSGVVAFENSNRNWTLLPSVSWVPLKAGELSFGVAGGVALFGYASPLLPAGGLVGEWMGKSVGADLTYIPRVNGSKGHVFWLRLKVPLREWR